jgi:hypothetical protein
MRDGVITDDGVRRPRRAGSRRKGADGSRAAAKPARTRTARAGRAR